MNAAAAQPAADSPAGPCPPVQPPPTERDRAAKLRRIDGAAARNRIHRCRLPPPVPGPFRLTILIRCAGYRRPWEHRCVRRSPPHRCAIAGCARAAGSSRAKLAGAIPAKWPERVDAAVPARSHPAARTASSLAPTPRQTRSLQRARPGEAPRERETPLQSARRHRIPSGVAAGVEFRRLFALCPQNFAKPHCCGCAKSPARRPECGKTVEQAGRSSNR